MKPTRSWDYWLLWFVALMSLALNVWLVNTLLVARRQLGTAAGTAAQLVAQLRAATIDYTVHVEQSVPVNVTVPLKTTVSIPLQFTVPVTTSVTVPLKTILGTFDLAIPIQTNIPVNLTTQVPIEATVPISTTVPIVLDAPVHIVLADTPLGQSLLEVQTYLEKASASLQGSLIPAQRSAP